MHPPEPSPPPSFGCYKWMAPYLSNLAISFMQLIQLWFFMELLCHSNAPAGVGFFHERRVSMILLAFRNFCASGQFYCILVRCKFPEFLMSDKRLSAYVCRFLIKLSPAGLSIMGVRCLAKKSTHWRYAFSIFVSLYYYLWSAWIIFRKFHWLGLGFESCLLNAMSTVPPMLLDFLKSAVQIKYSGKWQEEGYWSPLFAGS